MIACAINEIYIKLINNSVSKEIVRACSFTVFFCLFRDNETVVRCPGKKSGCSPTPTPGTTDNQKTGLVMRLLEEGSTQAMADQPLPIKLLDKGNTVPSRPTCP